MSIRFSKDSWRIVSMLKPRSVNSTHSSVTFLGYIFQGRQMNTDPNKIKAVAEWLSPTNRKQLQRFLGLLTSIIVSSAAIASSLSL